MDRALDEIVQENQRKRRGGRGGGRGPRRDDRPRDQDRTRDQDRKNGRIDRKGIDDDWIHDRYDDESGDIRGPVRHRGEQRSRRSPEHEKEAEGVKIRVENLHYDLTEDDLEDLFTRIAPVATISVNYDRAGRSTGTAYVTYRTAASAREAIREYDGANAYGQPIRLAIVPSGPSQSRRNPFDTAVQPSRSLFERVQDGKRADGAGRGPRVRSRSPRRSDVSRPAPEHIDRYIPGGRNRSRSPARRRRGGGGGGGGERRDGRRAEGKGERTGEGARLQRKTQEELDREMDDYWNKKAGVADGALDGATDTATGAAPDTIEIEMAE